MIFDTSSRGWISHGFEKLVATAESQADAVHFDVLIVGSGYGGAIAAKTFAAMEQADGQKLSVAVLERGQEYLPGSFPSGPSDAPGHMRIDSNKDGLFDVRLGQEVNTVIANGLGGGSLFNAGVMATPVDTVFNNGWPAKLTLQELKEYYQRCKVLLGSVVKRQNGDAVPNQIDLHPDGLPQKHQSIKALANENGSIFRSAELTVAMTDSVSSGNVRLNKCIRCGDCATGCNFGAKNSLDVNLLVSAHRDGATIYTGATVLNIKRDSTNNAWTVNCVYTNHQLRARHGKAIVIRAKHLIIAAGTLGTTEILLRSKEQLPMSDMLGRRCSSNGDMLIADYATKASVNAVADETVKPSERAIGPTITGVIDERTGKKSSGLVIEELSVPSTLQRVFAEAFATTNLLHSLSKSDREKHKTGFPDDDIFSIGKDQIENSAIYAAMGDDGAEGNIELGKDSSEIAIDGTSFIRWDKSDQRDALPDKQLFSNQTSRLEVMSASTGGKILPNPAWRILPMDQADLIGNRNGPLLTVHPLGGCAMANDASQGVVDDLGRVYIGDQPWQVYERLAVLDGSIIPTALGTNPALTIAAVALRAAETLATQWGFKESAKVPPGGPDRRPAFRDDLDVAKTPIPTEISVNERLSGDVRFRDKTGKTQTGRVELTVRYDPKKISDFYKPPRDGGNPVLELDTKQNDALTCSRIRIFKADKCDKTDTCDVEIFSAPLSGKLFVLERQKSRYLGRLWRCIPAWALNRGIRDSFQGVTDGIRGPGIIKSVKNAIALASRGGEMRHLRYELDIGRGTGSIELRGSKIVGIKNFTYSRRCNPWRQLMELKLTRFPGMTGKGARTIHLDLNYLAKIEIPLFQISRQENGVHGLAELASFFTWLMRQLLGIHIWSFRKPDPWKNQPEVDRLPSELPGVAKFERGEFSAGKERPHHDDGAQEIDAKICLTRYPRPDSSEPPIIMIHGYSAGGTSFAHHTIDPSYASHFWNKGRDVWILDMRTSPGMPTGHCGWSFEQIAYNDIPLAFEKVSEITGAPKIDVIAHCMGAVMFSMAILHAQNATPQHRFRQQRAKLPGLINRVVFSQVGPLVVFSPVNRFRSLFARYMAELIPREYSFVPEEPTLADDLFDRLLYSLPYPESEFDIENPLAFWKRTSWTRTRHRMDALYGRDFNVDNNIIDARVLEHIDDFFGPMSIKTVSQTIHFARFETITDVEGHNSFVARTLLDENWKFPTLSIHGKDNGLSDVATVERMEEVIGKDAGRTYQSEVILDAGHQDCLIGTGRVKALEHIDEFFESTKQPPPESVKTNMTAFVPWIGPLVTQDFSDWLLPSELRSLVTIRIGASPIHNEPAYVVLLKVHLKDGIIRPTSDEKILNVDDIDVVDINDSILVVESEILKYERWARFIIPHSFFPINAQDPANAILVMITYDEDLGLKAQSELGFAYFASHSATSAFGELVTFGFQNFLFQWMMYGPKSLPATQGVDGAFEKLRAVEMDATVEEQPDIDIDIIDIDIDIDIDDTPEKQPPEAIKAAEISSAMWKRIADAVLDELKKQPDLSLTRQTASTPNHHNPLLDGLITFIPENEPAELPVADGVSFALGSCQYPTPFIDRPVGGLSCARLVDRLDEKTGIVPEFAVLAGDQVYVDATAGLFDPTVKTDEKLRKPYENWLRQNEVRTALRQLPAYMQLDDHEIVNNWEPVADGSNNAIRETGVEAYRRFQRGYHDENNNNYSFRVSGYRFYMLDTRSARDPRKMQDIGQSKLIDDDVMEHLKDWLKTAQGPKFVVTPSMLLPRHRKTLRWSDPLKPSIPLGCALHADGWDGYPATLHELLAFITDNKIQQLVFLSGDEHLGCVATIDVTRLSDKQSAHMHSIHTSPLFAPLPFANASKADFVAPTDKFEFTHDTIKYRCEVKSLFPPLGDGFVFLRPYQSDGVWQLDYEFPDGQVKTLNL